MQEESCEFWASLGCAVRPCFNKIILIEIFDIFLFPELEIQEI